MRVGVVTEAGQRVADLNDVTAFVAAVGRNTGNIAFQQVVQQHLDDDVTYIGWTEHPSELSRRFDVLFVPEASVIVESKDFGWKADYIEAADLPVVTVGVGFQDPRPGHDPSIPNGTLRYLTALSERSNAVGVRGERTRGIVERAGIRNAVITGCPSLFWNTDADLGGRIVDARVGWPRRVRPAVAAGPDKRVLARVHHRLLDWVTESDGSWITQSGSGLNAALDGAPYRVPATGLDKVLGVWRARDQPDITPIAFSDAGQWIAHVAGFDVSVSPRIHASILATQAAVPSFCVAHDGRTAELAATCGIPTITPRTLARTKDIEQLIRNEPFDGQAFDRARATLATRYLEVLERSGLTPATRLRQLAEHDLS